MQGFELLVPLVMGLGFRVLHSWLAVRLAKNGDYDGESNEEEHMK